MLTYLWMVRNIIRNLKSSMVKEMAVCAGVKTCQNPILESVLLQLSSRSKQRISLLRFKMGHLPGQGCTTCGLSSSQQMLSKFSPQSVYFEIFATFAIKIPLLKFLGGKVLFLSDPGKPGVRSLGPDVTE